MVDPSPSGTLQGLVEPPLPNSWTWLLTITGLPLRLSNEVAMIEKPPKFGACVYI